MSKLIRPKNYFPLPNAAYFCGLILYKEAEVEWVPITQLLMSQDWVCEEQVYILKDLPELREDAGIAVRIDDYTFVMDGHHRAFAAYLRGDDYLKLRVVNLNKLFTQSVERHKGKDKIGLYDITASDLQEIGLLD